MDNNLIKRVEAEEKIAIKKWGRTDTSLEILLSAAIEELGEVAHAINHGETTNNIKQEIVETIGILSRLYNMVDILRRILQGV